MPLPRPVSHHSSLMKSSCETVRRRFGFAGVFRCRICLTGAASKVAGEEGEGGFSSDGVDGCG